MSMSHKNLLHILLLILLSFPYTLNADSKKNDLKRNEIRKLLNKRNLLALPSLASQAGSFQIKNPTIKGRTAKSKSKVLASEPPTLQALTSSPIKDIFWGDIDGVNVIDAINNNNFSAQSCGEFYSSTSGQSGGLGACHMAESVGYSYKEVIQSGTILCYIQNTPTKANQRSGGITIDSGKLPEGGIEKTFAVPEGKKSRIIKIKFLNLPFEEDTQEIFVEVLSSKTNKAEKNIYKLNLWMCPEGAQHPNNLDTITINNALSYINIHGGVEEFSNNAISGLTQITTSASGALSKQKNDLVWDLSSTRTSTSTYKDPDGSFFKSQVEITKENTIKVKRSEQFYGQSAKGIVITNFTGDSAENLRFLSGAFKEVHNGLPIATAAKYNGDFYAIDQENSLLPTVLSEDLESEYYTSGVASDVDTSVFSCDVTPDLSVTVDHDNPSVNASIAPCDALGEIFENTYFCHQDPEVFEAEQKARNFCS